jgi:hypothetical protein
MGDKSSLSGQATHPCSLSEPSSGRPSLNGRRFIPFRADGQERLDAPAALPGNPPGVEAEGRRRRGVAHLGGHVGDRRRGRVCGASEQQRRERVPQVVEGMPWRLLALGGVIARSTRLRARAALARSSGFPVRVAKR